MALIIITLLGCIIIGCVKDHSNAIAQLWITRTNIKVKTAMIRSVILQADNSIGYINSMNTSGDAMGSKGIQMLMICVICFRS